jgi:hypothetical protein
LRLSARALSIAMLNAQCSMLNTVECLGIEFGHLRTDHWAFGHWTLSISH